LVVCAQIHEMFDIICGTSTGGLIALAVGSHKMKCSDAQEFYLNTAAAIFCRPGERTAQWFGPIGQFFQDQVVPLATIVSGSTAYSHEPLEKVLRDTFGAQTLVPSTPKVILLLYSSLLSIML
jgi:patatin-like phospholipase/acyl hydrolase